MGKSWRLTTVRWPSPAMNIPTRYVCAEPSSVVGIICSWPIIRIIITWWIIIVVSIIGTRWCWGRWVRWLRRRGRCVRSSISRVGYWPICPIGWLSGVPSCYSLLRRRARCIGYSYKSPGLPSILGRIRTRPRNKNKKRSYCMHRYPKMILSAWEYRISLPLLIRLSTT